MSVSQLLNRTATPGRAQPAPCRSGQTEIRVLAISQYGDFGGPHNRLAALAPYWTAANVHVIALLPDGTGDAARRLRDAGLEVITRPLNRLRRTFDPRVWFRFSSQFWTDVGVIRELLRECSIDLVQVHGLLYPHGAVAARLEGLPVVWQLNDQFGGAAMRRALMPVVKRLADVVMTTGASVARAYPGTTSFGDRLVVFFPSVDANRFLRDGARRAGARRELSLGETDLVIGTIAHVNPNKDLSTFVRAAAVLRGEIPQSRFVILGKTYGHLEKYANSLWREASRLGLRLGCELVQIDGEARVAELAQAFDVFWLTSVTEGTPTSLAEAMALELPVVATDVGGVREIVENGITGFIVPPHNPEAFVCATRSLLQNRQLRDQMCQRARRHVVEQFTPELCASAHLRAYNTALAHHRLHPAFSI
jgi:glycosyltransferase involved in cell wall biosynthesis